MKSGKSGGSYLLSHFYLPRVRHDIAQKQLASYDNADTRRFYHHVVASTFCPQQREYDGYDFGTPIPWTTIQAKARRADIDSLIKRGIIEVSGYSRAEGRCREYKLVNWLIDELYAACSGLNPEEFAEQEFVNIFTGRRRGRVEGNRLYDENGHVLYNCTLAANAITEIYNYGCFFNMAEVKAHLSRLEARLAHHLAEYGPDHKAYKKAKRQYDNDLNCFEAVLAGGIKHISGSIWYYKPTYTIVMSGRVVAIGGAFQSCSRAMKHAAYSTVPNLWNFDLKSSQVNGWIQFLDAAGMDSSWPREYRDFEQIHGVAAKTYYAQRIGCSEEHFKKLMLGILFGGNMPMRLAADFESRKDKNSLIRTTLDFTKGDVAEARRILEAAREELRPMIMVMRGWHEYLYNEYFAAHSKLNRRSGYYIENAAGARLHWNSLPKGKEVWRAKAKIAAFLLQGIESAFIHHLTLIGYRTGRYKVVGNEHDGVIVMGAIDADSVEQARSLAGLENARLESKDFI